jgi:hypothetical protein
MRNLTESALMITHFALWLSIALEKSETRSLDDSALSFGGGSRWMTTSAMQNQKTPLSMVPNPAICQRTSIPSSNVTGIFCNELKSRI